MKMSEVIKMLSQEGSPAIAIGEYRSTKAETIKWRDKTTGQQKEMPICRHTVEFGGQSVSVSERIPDGTDTSLIKPPFAKGTRVLVMLQGLENVKGVCSASGTMTAIEDFAAAGRA